MSQLIGCCVDSFQERKIDNLPVKALKIGLLDFIKGIFISFRTF